MKREPWIKWRSLSGLQNTLELEREEENDVIEGIVLQISGNWFVQHFWTMHAHHRSVASLLKPTMLAWEFSSLSWVAKGWGRNLQLSLLYNRNSRFWNLLFCLKIYSFFVSFKRLWHLYIQYWDHVYCFVSQFSIYGIAKYRKFRLVQKEGTGSLSLTLYQNPQDILSGIIFPICTLSQCNIPGWA